MVKRLIDSAHRWVCGIIKTKPSLKSAVITFLLLIFVVCLASASVDVALTSSGHTTLAKLSYLIDIFGVVILIKHLFIEA